jgi:hypothetical protein
MTNVMWKILYNAMFFSYRQFVVRTSYTAVQTGTSATYRSRRVIKVRTVSRSVLRWSLQFATFRVQGDLHVPMAVLVVSYPVAITAAVLTRRFAKPFVIHWPICEIHVLLTVYKIHVYLIGGRELGSGHVIICRSHLALTRQRMDFCSAWMLSNLWITFRDCVEAEGRRDVMTTWL